MAISSNTVQIVIQATNLASNVLREVRGETDSLGSSLTKVGTQMTAATAVVSGALGVSTAAAIEYEEMMANTASILKITKEEQDALGKQLLDFGRGTRAGPEAVAESYYSIVSGVADVTTHMAILEAANRTAEAGNVDLASTTASVISVMNSYSFAADKAAGVSDVLTAIVGKGVGTMDQFAGALPAVTGLAASLNIPLEEVGGAMAYLTTKGFTASKASTQLQASMTAIIKPNANMTAALAELGFASGEAAIEQLGLVGAMNAIGGTSTVAEEGLAATLGSVEALNASLAFAGEGAEQFLDDFTNSVDGAAEAAQAIQMDTAAAQMDLFKSTVSALSITIGNAFIPAVNTIFATLKPVLDRVFNWMQANPKLTGTILAITAAVSALGPALMILGPMIGILASPITLVVGGLAALAYAFATNFGGIRDLVQPVLTVLGEGFERLRMSLGWFVQDVRDFGIIEALKGAFGLGGGSGGESWIEGVLVSFGLARETAVAVLNTITTAFGQMSDFITATVIPSLQLIYNWFMVDAIPAIIDIVQNSVLPIITSFFQFLGNAWNIIGPALLSLGQWFLETALPAILGFISETVLPGIQAFIDLLGGIWDTVSASLLTLLDWFITTGIPLMVTFFEETVVPGVQSFIDLLVGIWEVVSPALASMLDWFITTGLPLAVAFFEEILVPAFQGFIDLLVGVWEVISPALTSMLDWFITTGLPLAVTFFEETLVPAFQGFIDLVVGAWDLMSPVVDLISSGITAGFQGVVDIVNLVIGGIEKMIGWISSIDLGVLEDAASFVEESVLGGRISTSGRYDQTRERMAERAAAQGVPGFASGTGWTGSGSPQGVAGIVHNQEAVIPRGGLPLLVPTPRGVELQGSNNSGGSGGGGNTYQISVSVTEREILTSQEASQNGTLFGERIKEELRFNG